MKRSRKAIPHSVQPFWHEFHATVGGDVQARVYEAFHFDDNEPSANELAATSAS